MRPKKIKELLASDLVEDQIAAIFMLSVIGTDAELELLEEIVLTEQDSLVKSLAAALLAQWDGEGD